MHARAETPYGHLRAFREGVVACLPAWVAVAPFGAIFGTIATATGLDILQTMGMTLVVAAGASQLAALQLMNEGAPALLAILTGAVVNLRMAMYSAALAAQWPGAPLRWRIVAAYFLHDQAFAVTVRRHAERPAEPVPQRIAYFLGAGSSTIAVWYVATLAGAVFGAQMPVSWGLEFAVPVTFIAVTAPLLRTLPQAAAALTGAVLSLPGTLLPYGLGLVLAAGAAIAVGMATEKALTR